MAEAAGTLDEFAFEAWGGAGLLPRRIVFGQDAAPPPLRSLQVPFARLELVLEGCYRNTLCDGAAHIDEQCLLAGEALFVPADCWNKPAWDCDVRLLSLLFGAQHLGISLLSWTVERQAFTSVEKRSCLVPGNSPLYHMVAALSRLRDEGISSAPYGRLLAKAVIEYVKTLIVRPFHDKERQSATLYRVACLFLEENFGKTITRESVARQFRISSNYLSRVFRDQGAATFSDHLVSVRIGKARLMLEKYDLPLVAVAQRCGFHDVNYFFKVFKKRVGRTPSEYRSSVQAGAPRADFDPKAR